MRKIGQRLAHAVAWRARRVRHALLGAGRRAAATGWERTTRPLGLYVLRRSRWQIAARSYYSPIPDVDRLPESAWTRRSEMLGIELDSEAQVAFAETELAPYIGEARFPRTGVWGSGEFYLDNGSYQSVDAELLHAIVRRFKPSRIVELGSGWSTLVMAQACALNEREGARTELVAYEPYPRGNVPPGIPGLAALEPVPAQQVPLETFLALEENDILFVDTSHTVKLGGEVNFIVLDLLPRLRPGVLVHFHDIWLPYEYHRVLVEDMRLYWAEQYLLQAFLSFNDRYEVLWAGQAVMRERRERLARLVPSMSDDQFPSAFWLRRTAAA